MSHPTVLTLLAVAALVACNPPVSRAAANAPEPVEPAAAEPATPAPSAAAGDDGHGTASWTPWDEALALAGRENRPIMLFVYADWCPRCRELAPVFESTEVQAAAGGLVMVRHNQDEPAPWLREVVGDSDTYVPRVIFLNPDGSRRGETSPHPRYPYFYTPGMVAALVANMRTVTGG
jgi:thiol:disulfide interchange protein